MAQVDEQQVLSVLKGVKDPERGGDVVALGMIQAVVVKDGNVQVAIEIDPKRAPALEPLRRAVEQAVESLPGVVSATAVLTAERAAAASHQHGPGGHQHGPGGHQHGPGPGQPRGGSQKIALPGVKHIVAVASGKGGVGKSTVTANLAVALARRGLKVGLLDADIYGPSQPRMLGITGKPTSRDGKVLDPMIRHGLKVMSIGFLMDEETPVIWRGPMVMSALQQMLRDVAWGELDVLLVDMPPGTGDAQLTMAQTVPLAGSVIVSTPQDIALLDARKGLNMFRRVEVPVLGIVENMSYFACPHCGERTDVFGHGGARAEAERLGVECLGEVPLALAIRELSDAGTPIVAAQPDSAYAAAFQAIADRVWAQLSAPGGTARPAPRIIIE
jgi:ATP-binding protein involved in chromosome partitioning